MIWTMRVECIWGRYLADKCVRTIEMHDDSTLLGLHGAIQDAVNFDREHLYRFYVAKHPRARDSIVLGECLDDPFGGSAELAETTLRDIFPLPKRYRLFYRFDFGDNWLFAIRKSRRKPHEAEPGVRYPRVVDAVGPNPEQYGAWEWDDEEDDSE